MADRSATRRHRDRRSTFAWTPTPGVRETAVSYLSRLALLNGRRLADLRTETGIRPREIDLGEEKAIRLMSTLCGFGSGRLARWSPRRLPDRTWSLHGQNLGLSGPDRTFFRYCPACIRDDAAAGGVTGPYLRAEWQVQHVRSCPTHGLGLVAAAPERRQFEPFHFAETVAALLPDIDRIVGEARRVPATGFDAYLFRRLEGAPREAVWLDGMPLHAAASFCEVVGAVALKGKKVRPTVMTAAEAQAAAAEGHARIAQGPAGLLSFLAEAHAQSKTGRGVWGARASIGSVHVFLESRRDEEAYAPALEVVRDFLLDTVPFDEGDVLFGRPVEQRRIHTVRSASLQSGAHARTMRKVLVRAGFVDPAVLAERRDHHTTLDAAGVDDLLAQMKTSLTTPKVIERTGIPRLHLNYMIEAGHLPSLTRSTDVRWAKHKFGLRDVDALMARIFAGAHTVPAALPGLLDIMETRSKAVCTVQEIVTLVLEGKLAWKGRLAGRNDYMALLLDPKEVRRLVKREEGKGMTMIAAAGFIGMSQKSVKRFIDAGELKTVTEVNPVNRCNQTVVVRASAEAFKERYISLFEISKRHDLHFRRTNTMMADAGIEPAFDPGSFLTTFFERSRVDAFDTSRIDPKWVDPKRWKEKREAQTANDASAPPARPGHDRSPSAAGSQPSGASRLRLDRKDASRRRIAKGASVWEQMRDRRKARSAQAMALTEPVGSTVRELPRGEDLKAVPEINPPITTLRPQASTVAATKLDEPTEAPSAPVVSRKPTSKERRRQETEARVKAALAEAMEAAKTAVAAYEATCERGSHGHPLGGFGFANVYVLRLERSLWSAFREFGELKRRGKGYWKLYGFTGIANTGMVDAQDVACKAAAETLQKHFPDEGSFGAESYSD